MATDWTPPLQIWLVGIDIVAAISAAEAVKAVKVVFETTGEKIDEDDAPVPYEHDTLTIIVDEIGELPGIPERYKASGDMEIHDGEWRRAGSVHVEATVAAWLATLTGPTFLASTEW